MLVGMNRTNRPK